MSLRNTRPGIWLTFRCCRCEQIKLIQSAAHYRNLNDALGTARDRGWFIPTHQLCYCLKCAPAVRAAWARRKVVFEFEGQKINLSRH